MGVPILSKVLIALRESRPSESSQPANPGAGDEKKDLAAANVAAVNNGAEEAQKSDSEESLQEGVKAVEAVTLSWSKKTLCLVFFKSVVLFTLVATKTNR